MTDERPAAVRLASILGIRSGSSSSTSGENQRQERNGQETQRLAGSQRALNGIETNRTNPQESTTISSPSNWFKDKYQMATNKLMSKV